ncbi:MAG: MarR family transcriptional regulator [Betaproteobacteria bacterium]|nr:MAG: MarR family transcriptional regulator [Betaproteobacteria bacterium]TMI06354.1 MAG: MarR family transcriptional regulator [Betaproteobacteria bacterium]
MPRSMARTRRRGAPPRTISRPALLVDGSDGEFRGLIHDLIAYGHRLDACRDAFAAIVGISGVQYEILMLVSRADGLSIGEVAERLHRSGAFITIEANKLAERGILQKASDPTDGRRVLLKNTSRSLHLLERLAPHQRRINDVLFERLDARRFRQLRALARDLVASGDRAVAMLEFLLHEAQAA